MLTDSRWTTTTVLRNMATPDRQSMDSLDYSRRLQNTFSTSTPNISQDKPTTIRQSTATTSSAGDLRPSRETCNRTGSGIPRILQSNVCHSQKNGGFRPILKLRTLNQFVHSSHFKMENLQQIIKIINRIDFFTSIDLTDAFLHILVHKNSRRFLRFHENSQIFQFRTAPFGLSVIPWLFIRLTKPVLF
jgi:hypothetical protein